jgi:hypothetical protein
MRGKKKSRKQKKARPVLSQSDEGLLASLLNDFQGTDPQGIVSRIPNPLIARFLVESLPLDDQRTVPLMAALYNHFQDKDVRRSVKRAVFRLEKKGIPVEGFNKAGETPPVAFKPPGKERPQVWLGPIDGMGARAVLIFLHRSLKGVDVAVGLCSDETGIQEFLFTNMNKKRSRDVREHLSGKAGPLVETDLSHAATVLEQAYELHSESPSNVLQDYLELRPWLLDNASLLDRPAVYDLIPRASVPEGHITSSQLEKVFGNALFNTWILDFESLRPAMEDLRGIDESPILLNDVQKSERAREIREKSIKEIFSSKRRERLKSRFEEMAYIFFRTGDEGTSMLCLAAARDTAREGTMLEANPVLEFLMDRSLALYMQAAQGQQPPPAPDKDPSSGLIIP